MFLFPNMNICSHSARDLLYSSYEHIRPYRDRPRLARPPVRLPDCQKNISVDKGDSVIGIHWTKTFPFPNFQWQFQNTMHPLRPLLSSQNQTQSTSYINQFFQKSKLYAYCIDIAGKNYILALSSTGPFSILYGSFLVLFLSFFVARFYVFRSACSFSGSSASACLRSLPDL